MTNKISWFIADPKTLTGFYVGAHLHGTVVGFYYPNKRSRKVLTEVKQEVKEKLIKQYLIDNARDLCEEQYAIYCHIARIMKKTAVAAVKAERLDDVETLSDFTTSIRKRVLRGA